MEPTAKLEFSFPTPRRLREEPRQEKTLPQFLKTNLVVPIPYCLNQPKKPDSEPYLPFLLVPARMSEFTRPVQQPNPRKVSFFGKGEQTKTNSLSRDSSSDRFPIGVGGSSGPPDASKLPSEQLGADDLGLRFKITHKRRQNIVRILRKNEAEKKRKISTLMKKYDAGSLPLSQMHSELQGLVSMSERLKRSGREKLNNLNKVLFGLQQLTAQNPQV